MDKKHLLIEALLLMMMLGLAAVVWAQSDQVGDLTEQTEKLEARLAHLEDRPGAKQRERRRTRSRTAMNTDNVDVEPRGDGSAEPGEVRMWRQRAAEALDEAGPLDIDDPEVRMKLRKVVAEEQEYLREQRRARRQEQREEQIREQVKKIAETSGLDDATSIKVEDMLVVELAEVTDIFRKAREDGNWREMRDKVGAIREQTDQEAAEILSAEELEAYQKMREEEMSRWGRRGRGNRDRDRDDNEEKNGEKSKR